MHARKSLLLIPVLFAALVLTDFRQVAHAVSESNGVVSPAPTTPCAQENIPGTRCTNLTGEQLPPKCSKNNNAPAVLSFKASKTRVHSTSDCPAGACGDGGMTAELTTEAVDPDGDELKYTYSATGGRIKGDGQNVTWDLTGLAPGTYTVSVEFDDQCGCVGFTSLNVTVEKCSCESVRLTRALERPIFALFKPGFSS